MRTESIKLQIHSLQEKLTNEIDWNIRTYITDLINHMIDLRNEFDKEFENNKTSNLLMRIHNLDQWIRSLKHIIWEE